MAATLALGFWQLSRAAQKEALQASQLARSKLAPVQVRELVQASDYEPLVHRQASLRGTWVPARTIFLDNRQMNGKPGFYVVTPLLLEGLDKAVIIERGWVQRNFLDRTQLPQVPTPPGIVEVVGRIAPPPSKLYAFKGADSGVIRQNLDVAAFSAEIGLNLVVVSLMQTTAADDGLQREWPQPSLGVPKHYGYTFQWWALSALIATLYVWFQIVRRLRPPPRA
ncbi:MAG: SURF1 family protein [Bdellovibrionales bacterium]|nr:SURF1 family protein [Ramlibacter sp.]